MLITNYTLTKILRIINNYCQHRIKIIGQLALNSMAWALLRSRQIFKFGLLRKKKIIRKI
jgi:hypothetical protein